MKMMAQRYGAKKSCNTRLCGYFGCEVKKPAYAGVSKVIKHFIFAALIINRNRYAIENFTFCVFIGVSCYKL
jgi:hypothetical protein